MMKLCLKVVMASRSSSLIWSVSCFSVAIFSLRSLRTVACTARGHRGSEACRRRHAIEESSVAGKDGDNLVLDVHGEAALLEELGHASATGELLLGRLVEVAAELRERLQLAIGGQVEAQRTGNLLHGLDLRGTTDSGNRDADVDCRALALEEEVGLQEDLAVGDGDDVGRNVAETSPPGSR